MDTSTFLSSTLASDGYYCLWVFNRANERKIQKFFDTIQQLEAAALEYDQKGWDTYFALATFKSDESRTADNASKLRCFFLDLDCGPTKDYPDQTTAVQALQNFCMRMALPKPLLVDSGRGLHVYWIMDRDLTRDEWQPVADQLKATCLKHNFAMDSAVPADAARILRIPGTHNHKDNPPSPVTALSQAGTKYVSFEAFAAKFDGVVVAPRTKFTPRAMDAVTQQLLGNRTNNFKKILTRSDPCAQLLHAALHQASVDEPLWRATLSIAVHCEDADKAIQVVSRDHPDYDPDLTAEKAHRIKGPYLCTRFEEANPGGCDGCPHAGKIKSPIVLGSELRTAETEEARTVEVPADVQIDDTTLRTTKVVIPKPPAPYLRGVNGGVYKQTKDEDGEVVDVLIYHHDLYVTRRVYDQTFGDGVLIRLHLPQDGMREFLVLQSAVNSSEKLKEALSSQGVTAKTKKQWDNIGYYIMDYVDHLQAKEPADKAHRQMGWTEGMGSFVLGEKEYFPGNIRHSPPTEPTETLVRYIKPKGTLEKWQELMQFYNHEGMELHQLIICSAFGAPLMEFTAIPAMLMHLDGPTGFGKSTTQAAAASIYGRPAGIMIKADDTNASTFNRFEAMKNLPIYLDELTNCAPLEASTIAYSLSAGQQRMRMSSGSNKERERGEPWHLTAVSSGNASLMAILEAGKAMPDAERERVFEVNIKEYIYPYPKPVADAFQRAIHDQSYGVAGPVYIEWLVNNRKVAEEFLLQTQERLDAACGMSSTNRFISASFAAYLAGGMLAKRLGLIDFNMRAVFDLVVRLVRERLEYNKEVRRSSLEYLTQYVTENWNNVLRIESTQDRRAKDATGLADEFVVPDATPKSALIARWEPDTQRLYVLPKPFQKWCVDQQLHMKGVIDDIRKTNTVDYKKVRIDKGTKMNMAPIHAYVISLPSSALGEDAGTGD
jgi:hypothetical protein